MLHPSTDIASAAHYAASLRARDASLRRTDALALRDGRSSSRSASARVAGSVRRPGRGSRRGGGGAPAPFNPLTDAGRFALYRETTVDAGAGACSQWTDLIGTRHAVMATGANQPTITAADGTGWPSLAFTTNDYMPTTGVLADWAFLHSTADATAYIVFRPSTVSKDDQILMYGIADLVAGARGLALMYHGTRQTAEVFAGCGVSARLATIIGATDEAARDTLHIMVYRKNSAGFEMYLDGALLVSGTWNGVPSATAATLFPAFGGTVSYITTRQFEGKMYEAGILTSYANPAAITAYCRARYGITTLRTNTHKSLYQDGVNVGTGAPAAGCRVWSYYSGVSATPGTVKQVALTISRGTALQIKTRTDGTPTSVSQGSSNAVRVVTVPLAPAGIWADSRPIKALLCIGESTARGRSNTTGAPAGYPTPVSGAPLYSWGAEDTIAALAATEQPNVTYPVEPVWSPDSGTPGMGPGGIAAFTLQAADPASAWLYVGTAKGSTTSVNWASSATLYTAQLGAAIARVRRIEELALQYGRTIQWVGIIVDQGINDAALTAGTSAWATNWSSIETTLRGEGGLATCPIVYRQECTEVPTDVAYPCWTDVRTAQSGWAAGATPKRIMITADPLAGYVEAAHVHPNGPANATIGAAYAAAILAA